MQAKRICKTNLNGSVALIRQPGGPTEMFLVFTFTVQIRTATK